MKLLLIGDERKNRRMFAWGFGGESYKVTMASTPAAVAEALEHGRFQLACVDVKMMGDEAIPVLEYLQRRVPELPVIALVDRQQKTEVSLKQWGVRAQLATPFPIATLHSLVRAQARAEPVGGTEPSDEQVATAPQPAHDDGIASPLPVAGTRIVRDLPAAGPAPAITCQLGSAISLREIENAHIQMVIASTPTLEEAARILEIDKSTLYRKRKQMDPRLAKLPVQEPAEAAAG